MKKITETLYQKYKGFFYELLTAVVDADDKFLWVDAGGSGSRSDAQIYNELELKECLEYGPTGFPDTGSLPNDNRNMPYFFLGNDMFRLAKHLMKPHSHCGLTMEK